MTKLRRVLASDREELMDALARALDTGSPVQPVAPQHTPAPRDLLPGTAVVVHTSGSSGTPKFVAHSAESIRASAEATNEALGGAGQWLVALPTHLIAGLQMLTRSIVGGTDPQYLDGPFAPEAFIAQAQKLTGSRRYTSLVPVQLAQLLEASVRDPDVRDVMQRFDAILVGGQALSVSMRQLAHDQGIAVIRTYGMTETGGGVVYDGVEIGDTRVRIRDREVQLAGPSLALGYLDAASLTAEHFIDDGATRWYRTGDTGTLLGGMLQVTGRLDRVIISGGVNVSLDRVEQLLAEDLEWRAPTVAVPVRDATWGERVALVAETGGSATDASLRLRFPALQEHVHETLGAAAQPVQLTTIATLPRLANGKVDYRQILALVTKDEK